LGIVANQDRLYLSDTKNNVISQELSASYADAITAIQNQDYKVLDSCIKKLKDQQINKIARFLESNGDIQKAFEIVKDTNIKFEYAVRLGDITEASRLAELQSDSKKWKQIGDLSLKEGDFDQAEVCYKQSNDYASLFLMYRMLGKLLFYKCVLISLKVTKKVLNSLQWL
jgi:coatomer subunit beta'